MDRNKAIRIIAVVVILIVVNIQIIDMLKIGIITYEYLLGYVVGVSVCYTCVSLLKAGT